MATAPTAAARAAATTGGLPLAGRRVLVTGGARGVGRATVLALARAGADVLTCYRQDGAAADRLRGELTGTPGEHCVVRADVTDADAVGRLVENCRDRFGALNVLVNNAGIDAVAPFVSMSDQEWDRVIAANLSHCRRVTRAALPLLKRGASVVNIGAAVAARGLAGRTHYGAAKAGVIGFTRALSKEVGGRGIRVNAVAPGVVETDDDLPPPIRDRIAAATSLGRLGAPEDVADVVLFLASDLSRYVAGATITVDGGI